VTNLNETSHPVTIEALEGRTLFAAAPISAVEVAVNDGEFELHISGTSKADQISLNRTAVGMRVTDANGFDATFTTPFAAVRINAGAGNDSVKVDASVFTRTIIKGGAGNDVLVGGSGDDQIYGEAGSDTI
jgi:Ca2+-binding RTX toxin-like protein